MLHYGEGLCVFTDALFAIFYTSLALMFFYYRHKPIVSKLISLQILHYKSQNYFPLYFIRYSHGLFRKKKFQNPKNLMRSTCIIYILRRTVLENSEKRGFELCIN
jgi:hypothetical protein